MKLEQQVTSLELAKKLKELGVKQGSLYWWVPLWGATKIEEYSLFPNRQYAEPDTPDSPDYSAFTVSELGEILKKRGDYFQEEIYVKSSGELYFRIYDKEDGEWFEDLKEADARAKMLIYLLENKLLEH